MLKTYAWVGCAVALATLGSGTVSAGRAGQANIAPIASLVDRFLTAPDQPLVSYRAFRRLSASTRGGRYQASLEAWTTLDPVKGFTYEITKEEGSGIVRRRVLIAALEAEAKFANSPDGAQSAITRANYDFLGVTDDSDHLIKVDVRPWRKQVTLIQGSLFLESESADLVRLEGELSQRPSFWTRRVRVEREYARVEGIHVPVAMRSTANVLIVGPSSFEMTYQYTEINGRPVVLAKSDSRNQ
jgi:hypothetical protein